jgi:hypothetical protein
MKKERYERCPKLVLLEEVLLRRKGKASAMDWGCCRKHYTKEEIGWAPKTRTSSGDVVEKKR